MEYQIQSREGTQVHAPKSNRHARERKDALWGYVFILPQLLGMLAFSLLPLLTVFYLSTVSWDGLGPIQFVGLQNFINRLTSDDLRISLLHAVYYTVLSVPGGLVLALLIALGLNNVRG